MRVKPGNAAALRCYRVAGFRDVAPPRVAAWNAQQPVPYTWMEQVISGS